ncbi:MAG: Gfo/Idh/MocA family oxidoreductase [Clostridia bacterium]|nr:Gfo/Idh/MocA family oxidoreductase [Clostridia bacterium]
MPNNALKIGILGFGAMGKAHAYAITNLPYFYSTLPFSASIAGVCASTPERTQARVAPFGLPAASSEDSLINDPNIDIIDICTPNRFHYASIKKALAAGKHVLCEKPLGMTEQEGAELAELAAKSGRVCRVVFNNRFIPAIMRAKQLIEEGRLGRILSFHAAYLHNSCLDPAKPAGWKQNADICGGGVLYDLGSHVIDLIIHLCGPVSAVSGMAQIGFTERTGMNGENWQTNADEAFYLMAELACGAHGTMTLSKLSIGANDDLTLDIRGTQGAIRFSLMEPSFLEFYDAASPDQPIGGLRGFTRIECVGRTPAPGGAFPSPKAPVGWLRGHIGSMYAFLDAVHRGDTQSGPTFAQGAEINRIMAAAYRSAECGQRIVLREEDCL